eukprot:gnl/Spiro4/13845_TR7393_c0_g1_i1.p3 gnl/Spiro4/13845_TR7393_c0_g1~~gnl/Spiro4/13845_TR7393_c0_g1_i1.p3  ORF type:complete len:100 (+),score=26.78 gnl/Spiro4/13845_TR7393_c0_g1_i1:39-302(+)
MWGGAMVLSAAALVLHAAYTVSREHNPESLQVIAECCIAVVVFTLGVSLRSDALAPIHSHSAAARSHPPRQPEFALFNHRQLPLGST